MDIPATQVIFPCADEQPFGLEHEIAPVDAPPLPAVRFNVPAIVSQYIISSACNTKLPSRAMLSRHRMLLLLLHHRSLLGMTHSWHRKR